MSGTPIMKCLLQRIEEGMRVRVECRSEVDEMINVENGETTDEDRALVVDVVVLDA